MNKLSKLQLDALREIGSMGAGNAATGLSRMLNKRIDITMPSAEIYPLEKVPDILGGVEKLVTAIYIRTMGEISGSVLLICGMDEALELSDMLTGKEQGATKILDEFGQSALKELTNIITGCYVDALAKVVNMRIMHSIPAFASDMLGAIIDGILIKLGMEIEYAVIIETEFIIKGTAVRGHLLFLPDPEGLKAILRALEMAK